MPRPANKPGRRAISPTGATGITISARLPPELHDRLAALRAGERGYTVAEIVALGVQAAEAKRARG